MTHFPFEITARSGKARLGRLVTSRGVVRTPAFMPVGTAGTVKGLTVDQIRAAGADIILGNTYHLMLRPGPERLTSMGGLHQWMRWPRPILTDSGGFQIWSLKALRALSEEGVKFKSHIDGSTHFLSPERAVSIQADAIGADIVMQLDECTPYGVDAATARESMLLSARWAQRCVTAFGEREHQTLFGIVQGGIYPELRRESAARLRDLDPGGYAVGGLAVGEGHAQMLDVLADIIPELPAARPRYLMGVGKPLDIIRAVALGVDMFDCVLPTRAGRHGQAWTWQGPINLRNARFAEDEDPLDGNMACSASSDYSKSYLHHLFKAEELLGAILLSWHNIAFFEDLMARLRERIAQDRLDDFVRDYGALWANQAAPPRSTE